MFSAALKSGAAATPTDPRFNYVTMLLHGDGTNGGQNNTFLDSSTNNFTITRNGNTTQGSFSPYGANWSNYFDGSTAYLTAASNTAFAFGTGDWTIECWVFVTNTSAQMIFVDLRGSSSTTTAPLLYMTSSGVVNYYTNGSIQITGSAITANTWTHLAVARSGTSTKLFINGTQAGSTYSDSNNYVQQPVYIARASDTAGSYVNGYMSNVRLVKGTAVYTSAFTPSTTPLTAITNTSLLTCQSNRFIDNSSNAFTITVNGSPSVQRFSPFAPSAAYSTATIGGSGYFDGSGDYLATPTLSTIGSGDFSQEAWVYTPSNSGTPLFWDAGAGAGTFLLLNGSTSILGGINGSTAVTATYALPLNCWNHLVYCRSGTTVSIFSNGTRIGTATAGTSAASGSYYVGMDKAVTRPFTGYMCGTRFIHGSSAYDATASTITVPTAPVTAITNTQLLLSYTNAAIFDNAEMNDLETVGNAQVSTSVKKYGTGSMYFDGTGDYLKQVKTPNITFGTGAFTFEFWFRTSASTQYMSFFSNESGGGGFTILINSSAGNGVIQIYNGGSGLIHASSSGGYNDGNWHFLVLDRDSSGSRLFIDGTQQGSTNSGQASAVFDGGDWIIGNNVAYGSRDYNGYIDDLRITKGYARYTANFTPPTAAFPNQ